MQQRAAVLEKREGKFSAKSYEYPQTLSKWYSYCTKAVLNRLSDTFLQISDVCFHREILFFFNTSFD